MGHSPDVDTYIRNIQLKLPRVIDEYGLDGIGGELERRWTADGDDRAGLRDLADYFNTELLTTVLDEGAEQPLDAEVENVYQVLTDTDGDDGDGASGTRMRRRLEEQGLDVDRLLDDFVTFDDVRAYLVDERRSDSEQVRALPDDQAETIRLLQGRLSSITEEKLEHLRSRETIALGEFRAYTDVTVVCVDCGEQNGAAALLDRGGCSCKGHDVP